MADEAHTHDFDAMLARYMEAEIANAARARSLVQRNEPEGLRVLAAASNYALAAATLMAAKERGSDKAVHYHLPPGVDLAVSGDMAHAASPVAEPKPQPDPPKQPKTDSNYVGVLDEVDEAFIRARRIATGPRASAYDMERRIRALTGVRAASAVITTGMTYVNVAFSDDSSATIKAHKP